MVERYHKLIRRPPVARSCHSHYTYNHKFVVETLSIRIKGISFNKSLQRKSFCRITSAFECDSQTRTFPFIMKVLKMYDACWQIRNFSSLRPGEPFSPSQEHIFDDGKLFAAFHFRKRVSGVATSFIQFVVKAGWGLLVGGSNETIFRTYLKKEKFVHLNKCTRWHRIQKSLWKNIYTYKFQPFQHF